MGVSPRQGLHSLFFGQLFKGLIQYPLLSPCSGERPNFSPGVKGAFTSVRVAGLGFEEHMNQKQSASKQFTLFSSSIQETGLQSPFLCEGVTQWDPQEEGVRVGWTKHKDFQSDQEECSHGIGQLRHV